MKTCYLIFFLFFSSFIGVGVCYGQGTHGVIEGRVTHHGTGVSNAITIMFDGEIAKGGAATDSEGVYTIKPLSPGRYMLKVFHADFDTLLVTDVLITPDNNTIIDPVLNAKGTHHNGKAFIKYTPPITVPKNKIFTEEIEKGCGGLGLGPALYTTPINIYKLNSSISGNQQPLIDTFDRNAIYIDGVRVQQNTVIDAKPFYGAPVQRKGNFIKRFWRRISKR